MATDKSPQSPAQTSRSNKPDLLKLEVWTRHALRQSNSQIARDLRLSRNTVAKIIAERQVEQVSATDARSALASAGITPGRVAEKLREGMEATEVKLATWQGKFTDRVDVPDNSARFRYVEAAGKILEMFPREDTSAQAALFVRMPTAVLVPGHKELCTCAECRDAWNKLANTPSSTPTP